MMMPGASGYSIYDLLRTLIERVGWPSEEEKRVALASVAELERTQVFGNLATSLACQHETGETDTDGKCIDCGRLLRQPQTKYGSGNRRYIRGAM
jgi:hypothetical protein